MSAGGPNLGQPGSGSPVVKESRIFPLRTRVPVEAGGARRRQTPVNPALALCQCRTARRALKTGLKMARLCLSYLLYPESLQRAAGFHAEFSSLIPLC